MALVRGRTLARRLPGAAATGRAASRPAHRLESEVSPTAAPRRHRPQPAEPSAPPSRASRRPSRAPAEPPAAERHEPNPRLLDPKLANETAPERFTVLFETTAGDIHLDVRRSWAPLGADRFYNLVRIGYFDGAAFFRVVEGFVAQAGIAADPEVSRAWRAQRIDDDPVTQSNMPRHGQLRGERQAQPHDAVLHQLGRQRAPRRARLRADRSHPRARRRAEAIRRVRRRRAEGRGPAQARIEREGDAYLKAQFPKLDTIKRATVVDEKPCARDCDRKRAASLGLLFSERRADYAAARC